MQNIINTEGKMICRADPRDKRVEIVRKGIRTVIRFTRSGAMEVMHEQCRDFTAVLPDESADDAFHQAS